MKKTILAFLLFGGLLFLASCDKADEENDGSIFFGRWKTSYDDTVLFHNQNGKNMVQYDASMNANLPAITNHEYRYIDGKFSLNHTPNSGDDYFWEMDTFKWLEYGKSFQVQGLQWFMFLQSTQTIFTFTRIP
jgi:hypothetical protein